MARAPRTSKGPKQVTTLNHEADVRRNIPTAELADLAAMQEERDPLAPAVYPRARPLAEGEVRERDEDLDPQILWNGVRIRLTKDQVAQLAETGEIEIGDAQLVWRGKDRQDWSDLIVTAPPLYIQEKVHPKAIIDDLVRQSKIAREDASDAPDLFADFNGLADPMARTEFYQHDQHWSNRMILGDSLQVMASLAEREALKGKVQAIYFDPPYGIKFGSNWQVSTQNRDVKDGKQTDVSREPEQVKAFRDTWKDGIHSYLTYLRDRLTVMRELLSETGSIFVQIGDENVHRVRAVMDEVFGDQNFISDIVCVKTSSSSEDLLPGVADHILWYSRNKEVVKYRPLFSVKLAGQAGGSGYRRICDASGASRPASKEELEDPAVIPDGFRLFASSDLTSQRPSQGADLREFFTQGVRVTPGKGTFKTDLRGLTRCDKAGRLIITAGAKPAYRRYL